MSPTKEFGWKTIAGVVALLILHVVLALGSAAHRSTTVDELFHVTGGYFFDTLGDYRLHPENGILPQRLQALPAVLSGAKPPRLDRNVYWDSSDLWIVGYQFFYEAGNDHWPILQAARRMNLLFNLATCLVVFLWARSIAGSVAGFVALALAACSPSFLAHGPMATTDAAAAFFLPLSAGAFWWQLNQPAWRNTLLSAAIFGLACVAKMSAVLLLPTFILLVLWHAVRFQRAGSPNGVPWGHIASSLALHGLFAWTIIWAFFGFRFSAFAPGASSMAQFVTAWDVQLGRAGPQGVVIRVLRDIHFLPEAFLYGYTHTYVSSLSRASFLAGEYSVTGWRTFFPLAFLWKSSPAELLGFASALLYGILRWRFAKAAAHRFAPLLVFGFIYLGVAIQSNLNIGHRHLLPLYPGLFIAIGVLLTRTLARWRLPLALGLGGLQAISALAAFPYYIPYYNFASGGSENGWRLLVDSSTDWGQDLPGLKTWLDERARKVPNEPTFLSYFGSGEPNYYHIRAARIYAISGFSYPQPWYRLTAGTYCISATMLQGVYASVRGDWTLEREREYQELRRLDPQFREFYHVPEKRAELLANASAENWEKGWRRFDALRFARLTAYLKVRAADAAIGHSIQIFTLTQPEVDAAINGTYREWAAAVEATLEKNQKN